MASLEFLIKNNFSNMKVLKPCLLSEKEIIKIYRSIRDYLNTTLYNIITSKYKDSFENKLVLNETREEEELKTYFINNTLSYKDGYIYGKFNTKILKLLEKIGGKYIGYKHAFKIGTLPATIYNIIYEKQRKVSSFVYDLDEYLNEYLNNLETSINFSSIDYKTSIQNLNTQLQTNFSNIEIIPTLTIEEIENINKEYVENTKLYIKGWLNRDIIKLRENLKDYVLNKGYSNNTIAKIIKDNYKTTQKHSLFLARQESSLLLASYTEKQYKDLGIKKYKWLTANDERVRNYPINNGEGGNHKILNNKIFTFDNPPITNVLTGERYNPGRSFNCRCVACPIIE